MKINTFTIIAAHDDNLGIGKDGGLPWPSEVGDLPLFKKITSQTDAKTENLLLCGYNTYISLPKSVLTCKKRLVGVWSGHALQLAPSIVEKIFCIGGAKTYANAINHPQCDKLIITEIPGVYDCDCWFPAYRQTWKRTNQIAERTWEWTR